MGYPTKNAREEGIGISLKRSWGWSRRMGDIPNGMGGMGGQDIRIDIFTLSSVQIFRHG